MQLPTNLQWNQASSQWPATLNPLLANPIVNGYQISGIQLTANTPKAIFINLGQTQTGWIVTDMDAAATVYRTQPLNAKSLTLQSSEDVTISLWIF